MKKIIAVILILLAVSICFARAKRPAQKLKMLKPRCIMGYLYQDWVGRQQFESIPVLDKDEKMVKCTNECEE